MKADRKTTKPISRGKSKTQEAPPTHKAVTPKPHEKKTEGNQEDESLRHNRDLLLALSRAAQAVQRTRTPEQVYRVVGEEIKTLGYNLMIFSLSNDREHLNIAYTTIAANLLRAAEKLTRLPMQSYRLPIQAESIFGRVVAGVRAEFLPSTRDTVAQVLPKVLRPLAGQLMTLLKVERGIVAPLCADGATLGVLAVTASVLRETDVPAVETFAAQVGISLLNARLAQQAQEELEERERAEKNLRESEERFRTLIENASDMIVTISADGNLNYVSPAALRITGYQADEVIGRNIVEFIHADDLPLALQALASRSKISGLAPDPIELRFHHKDGRWRIVEILGNNLLDYPAVKGIVLNVRDITDRKQAEAAVRESEDRYRDLVENSQDLICTHDLDGQILSANPRAEKMLGYERSALLQMNFRDILAPEARPGLTGYLRRITKRGADQGQMIVQTKTGERRIWEYNNTLRTEGVSTPIVRGMARDITERKQAEQEIDQLARFPSENPNPVLRLSRDGIVMYANAASGALLAMWGCAVGGSAPQFWRDLAAQLLVSRENKTIDVEFDGKVYSMFVTPIAEADYVNLYGRDTTERKRAEEALRKSEERFRALVEHSHDAIVLLAADGTVLYDSPSIVGVLGYNPTERIGRKVFEFVHPEERQDMALGFAKFIQQPGAVAPSEVRFLHKDGTLRQIEGVRTNLLHEPAVRAVVVNYRDITERKRAEAQIAYQANLLAQVSDSIVASDEQFRLTFWNTASEAIYGWKAEQVLGRNGLEIVRTEWPGEKAEEVRRTIAETGRFQGEATQQRKDGTRFPVEISSLVLHDDSGQITGYVSVNRDITERKRAEEAVRDSEKHFRALIENSSDAITLLDAKGIVIYDSPASPGMLGYAPEDWIGRDVFALIHPDDLPKSRDLFQHLGETPGDRVTLTFRVRHKSGSWLWIEMVATNLLAEPSVQAIVLNYRDITERKQAEEEIRSQLEELERWQDVMLGRGDREQKLKREVNELCRRAGESARYPSQEIGAEDSETAPAKS